MIKYKLYNKFINRFYNNIIYINKLEKKLL